MQQLEVKLLLEIGTNVEAKIRDRSTVLHLAVFFAGGRNSVEAKTQYGFAALHMAVFLGCETVVQ